MNKSVVFTFGRMNPITTGHQVLIDGVQNCAASHNADHIVFLSHTKNNKTDPLDWSFKCRMFRAAFPGVKLSKSVVIKTPFDALKALAAKYDDVTIIVGSDRTQEFQERMTPYAALWGVKKFKVKCAGKRDPDSNNVSGMSSSKIRDFAMRKNEEKFNAGLPDQLNSAMKKQVYLQTVKGLKSVKKRDINARIGSITKQAAKR